MCCSIQELFECSGMVKAARSGAYMRICICILVVLLSQKLKSKSGTYQELPVIGVVLVNACSIVVKSWVCGVVVVLCLFFLMTSYISHS